MSSYAQDVDKSGGVEPAATQPLYCRPMPGGRYVRVGVAGERAGERGGRGAQGPVVIEQRSFAPPAPDDEELIVEEVDGANANMVVAELFRIARDNAAIARRVLRKQAATLRAD